MQSERGLGNCCEMRWIQFSGVQSERELGNVVRGDGYNSVVCKVRGD